MSKPYIYLAVSKKVPKHLIDELKEKLHNYHGVPFDQIKMHERGSSYNASKAENAALTIGVTHCSKEKIAEEICKYFFPKGSYGELRSAKKRSDDFQYIYDIQYKNFHFIDVLSDFEVFDHNDWANKYGRIYGVKCSSNELTKSINTHIMKRTDDYKFDEETGEVDLRDLKTSEKENKRLLLL